MKTYIRSTLVEKEEAILMSAIDLRLKTIKFIVIDKVKDTEKSFDDLDMAYLSYCFITAKEVTYAE